MPDFDFGPADRRACERLVYAGRIASASDAGGTHRVRRHGEGSEFLDYRAYVPGDDVRRIDWTVFARLRHPYVRVLQHETTLHVHLLVDVSRSMAAGEPISKAATACRLACLLGYVALAGGDRVSVATYTDRLGMMVNGLRGRAALGRLIATLRAAPLGGPTDLAVATAEFCRRSPRRGLVVLLSDFHSRAGYADALRRLLAQRFRLLAVQVLAPVDWGADLQGTLQLRDSESGELTEIVVTPRALEEYQRRVRHHAESLQRFCHQRQQYSLYAATGDSPSAVVARALRRKGLLR
jgi:uncharacterized protein (DUF58 family)